MKAVILSGGEGTRLRPLTCTVPKPIVRISGKPVIEYTFDLLIKHGFDNAALTLGYMSDVIQRQYENGYKGLKISFITERIPLGTAGAVKNALTEVDEPVLVISGDGIFDFDLQGIIKYHKANSAAVTVVAKRVNEPREYGLVNIGKHNRIIGFTEKPGWNQAVINTANTGVYVIEPEILSMIPEYEEFDFAKDLFPLLLSENIPMFCYVEKGYWCDVGCTESYLTCQNDALDGKFPTEKIDVLDHSDYKVIPPVYIDRDADISLGAVIGPYASIDSGCKVSSGARIRYSVLNPNVYVGENASVTGSLICPGAVINRESSVYENSVIGSKAVLGSRCTVKTNVKIWPEKTIPQNSVVDKNVKFGFVKRIYISGDSTDFNSGEKIDVESSLKFGRALGSSSYAKNAAILNDGSSAASVLSKAFAAGFLSAGGSLIDFGTGFKSQLNYFVNSFDLDCGVFISGKEYDEIYLCSEGGLPLPRYFERDIENLISSGNFKDISNSITGKTSDSRSMGTLYENALIASVKINLAEMNCDIKSKNPLVEYTLKNVLSKLGVQLNGNITFLFDYDGFKLKAYSSEIEADHYMLFALACIDEMEKGNDIAIQYEAPEFINALGEKYGVKVHRYLSSPSDDSDQVARMLASKQPVFNDALFLALKILSMMKERGKSLTELLTMLPQKFISTKDVEVNFPVSSISEALKDYNFFVEKNMEGVRITGEKGEALILPKRSGEKLKVLAQADSVEFADEICSDIALKIKKYNNYINNNTLT